MNVSPDTARRLEDMGFGHVLEHLTSLPDDARARLAADLDSLDCDELARALAALRHVEEPGTPPRLEPLPTIVKGAQESEDESMRRRGLALIAGGHVAAFLVAGGQGTRLGHAGPKGTFAATAVKGRSLFEVFAAKLRAREREAGGTIPLYVMTSPENHEDTVTFFEGHGHFGLDPERVTFFMQGTMPAVDEDGRLVLAEPERLFRSPDGHGGSLRALRNSGALDDMRARGVEEIFYFQVDNPLVDICDPVFLGYHASSGSEFSSKAVPKRHAGEKVGVLVRKDGEPGVIEYSDMPPELLDAVDSEGTLTYRSGNIAVHAMRRAFVERITAGEFRLPFHLARKKIPVVDGDGARREIPGIKFETFVFDALPLAKATMVMDVRREEEFSPIKNAEGEDSAATSRRDQSALFAGWIEKLGIDVPRDEAGFPVYAIEIDPLYADSAARLAERAPSLPSTLEADLVLEEV